MRRAGEPKNNLPAFHGDVVSPLRRALEVREGKQTKESIQGIGGREGKPKGSETSFWKS